MNFPIGVFRNHDAENAAIFDESVTFPRIVGIAKNQNGFAKTGYNLNLCTKFVLNERFFVVLSAGGSTNNIRTKEVTYLLIKTYDLEYSYEEQAYRWNWLMPGFGYYHKYKDFDISISFSFGYSLAQYPYYKFVMLYAHANPPLFFAHQGSQSNLSGFIYYPSLSFIYHITPTIRMGFDVGYMNTSFSYSMSTSVYPGGSQFFNFNDKLNVTVLTIGLKFGVAF